MPSWPTATLECFMPNTRRASRDASRDATRLTAPFPV
jgi:hypothetical protein